MNNKKVIIFSVVSLFFVLFALTSIYKPNDFLPYYVTRPAFLGFMMFMYVSLTKKPIKLFLVCQLLTLVGEFIQYRSSGLDPLAVLFYALGLFAIIKVVFSFIRKVKLTDFLIYLVFYLLFFAIIFIMVLDKSVNKISAFIYGVTFVILATLVFVNFLMKMSRANLLIFVAIIIGSVSNSIISMNVTDILIDKPVLMATTLTSMLTHYLICLGFIYKENDVLLKDFEF